MSLRQQHGAEIDAILARYPQKKSAILALLYVAQDTYGRLSDEAIREVATIIDVPPTDVFEVVGLFGRPQHQRFGTPQIDADLHQPGHKQMVAGRH